MDNDIYAITHTHRHGVDTYTVRCHREPTVEDVVEALGIDYEPDMEEEIVIDRIRHIHEIKDVPVAAVKPWIEESCEGLLRERWPASLFKAAEAVGIIKQEIVNDNG